jgi:hypothetical protein
MKYLGNPKLFYLLSAKARIEKSLADLKFIVNIPSPSHHVCEIHP